MVFQLPPLSFHEVKFWAIGRQVDHDETTFLPVFTLPIDLFASMDAGTVYKHDGWARISLLSKRLYEVFRVLSSSIPFNLPGTGLHQR